ncbi:hypothetical protein QAD02_022745 [Eretmocerus hayati]|uniref:Uncharacterized protein n=1 Tax=Eretmocerus hayati TaxID=131215 RepID=A0ACC2PVZ2_9HYME|nr:hypothetical protein QAD02_022745 [Eretmocerus hayati]
MEDCPYLTSIQSLKGRTPPEKYRELYSIESAIVNDEKERSKFLSSQGATDRVQPPLLPLLRILVGDRLKLPNFIADALKSDDVSVIKRALNASWFFESTNLDVNLILNDIVPKVSPRTRNELVKVIARNLKKTDDAPEKAELLFDHLADSYSLELALPLLVACGVEDDPKNKQERRIHKIDLREYASILPALLKRHLSEFLKLHECISKIGNYHSSKLGQHRAKFFLKNASKNLIEKPKIFLPILSLKLVKYKFTEEQFDLMYANLFPDDRDYRFNFDRMINYLRFHPQNLRMQKFRSACEQKYKVPFSLENFNKNDMSALRDLLSWGEKEEWARKKLKGIEDKLEYYSSALMLPPSECIAVLTERIKKVSDATSRSAYIQDMIKSCAFYNSKEDLTNVLKYYEARHKNEQYSVLPEILRTISVHFGFDKMEETHWKVLLNLASRAYTKNEIIGVDMSTYRNLFQNAVNFYLKQIQSGYAETDAEMVLTKQIDIILELCFESNCKSSPIVHVDLDLKENYLTRLLRMIMQKYPENHEIWNDDGKKNFVSLCLLNAMNDINFPMSSCQSKKKSRRKRGKYLQSNEKEQSKPLKITIKNYPWLRNFIVSLIKPENSMKRDLVAKKTNDRLKMALRLHDLELYQSLVDDDPNTVPSFESNEPRLLLKRDSDKVLDNWKIYLDLCRKNLSKNKTAARTFVKFCKWYQDLPLKFVEESLLSIEESGSVLVLGLLLDGETFSRIASRYHPSDDELESEQQNAKKRHELISSVIKAMNYTNPPMPLDAILPFCKSNYLPLITTVVPGLVRRTSACKTIAFVNQTMQKPISIKKLGIRLITQVASTTELAMFLENICRTETNPAIRELTAKMIFDIFIKFPSNQTWELMKVVIAGLNEDDEPLLRILTRISSIDRAFLASYIQAFLPKLDSFVNQKKANVWVGIFMGHLDRDSINLIPEEILTVIVRKIFPEKQPILIEIYAFSDPERFPSRLRVILELLKNIMQNLDKPDSKSSRVYPANDMVHNFLKVTVDILLESEQKEMSRLFVDELLQLFSSTLKPFQVPRSYISIRVLKAYMESENPNEFGKSLCHMTNAIIGEFGSEYFINDIAEIVTQFVGRLYRGHNQMYQYPNSEVTIARGLMTQDERLGSLIGLGILKPRLNTYGTEYDELVEVWRKSENIAVKAAFRKLVTTASSY